MGSTTLVGPAGRSRMRDDERRRLEERLERDLARLSRAVHQAEPREYLRVGDDLDRTAQRMEFEAAQSARARHARAIAELGRALRTLRRAPDDFGRCDRCGEPISLQRLEVLPATRTCAVC